MKVKLSQSLISIVAVAAIGLNHQQVHGGGCIVPDDCGIQNAGDCLANTFPNAGDPVEVHMNALGILLDGDVSDALAAEATSRVDSVSDEGGTDPGPSGCAEAPRRPAGISDANGFNIGRSVLLFAPDSNPIDGVDDSFLYIGWDICDVVDLDGLAPRQYDSDDNDSASVIDPASGVVSDLLPELYQVFLQGCTNPDVFDPALSDEILAERDPKSILTDFDANLILFNIDVCSLPSASSRTPQGWMHLRSPRRMVPLTSATSVSIWRLTIAPPATTSNS